MPENHGATHAVCPESSSRRPACAGPRRGNPQGRASAWRTLFVASLGFGMVGAGCASTGSQSAGNNTPARNSRVITSADLAEIMVSDAYQAVERLRPLWLLSESRANLFAAPEVVVLQNDRFFGNLQSLHQIPISPIREIRYMPGTEAMKQFPFLVGAVGRIVAAAIVVSIGAPGP